MFKNKVSKDSQRFYDNALQELERECKYVCSYDLFLSLMHRLQNVDGVVDYHHLEVLVFLVKSYAVRRDNKIISYVMWEHVDDFIESYLQVPEHYPYWVAFRQLVEWKIISTKRDDGLTLYYVEA